MEVNQSTTETIINTINTIFNNLFSSIDNSVYSILDKIVFINKDIFSNSILEKLLGNSGSSSLLILANGLLFGFALFYCFRLLFSNLYSIKLEPPHQFLFKLIIFAILLNSSYFICEKFIDLNYLISTSIREIGENALNTEISFSKLIEKINSLVVMETDNFNIFSFDGLIKSFTSISLINLIFSYSLRYILIKIFILITPFAILCLTNSSTSWFFKSWFKTLLSLLILESFISIILLISFSINFTGTDNFAKILFIGSIYALTKANQFIRELVGGISTDISANIGGMTNMFKGGA